MEADEIKSEDNFKLDLGMSSFDIVCVTEDVKAEFGVTLTSSDFVSNKTVGEMAKHLESVK